MSSIPETMAAVLLTGHGGFDKLEYREDSIRPTEFDLQDLIGEIGEMLDPKAEAKGLTVMRVADPAKKSADA